MIARELAILVPGFRGPKAGKPLNPEPLKGRANFYLTNCGGFKYHLRCPIQVEDPVFNIRKDGA